MEPSYNSAVALIGRAAGPLAGHLGPFVASLIDQKYAASVVHIKARHAGSSHSNDMLLLKISRKVVHVQ